MTAMQQSPSTSCCHPFQEEIERAGRDTRRLRRALVGIIVALPLGLLVGGVTLLHLHGHRWTGAPFVPLAVAAVVVGGSGVVGLLVAIPFAAASRRGHRSHFRARLTKLPPEQRTGVLEALAGSKDGDTRKIVLPLLREFASGSRELTPVGGEPRGTELSPPEDSSPRSAERSAATVRPDRSFLRRWRVGLGATVAAAALGAWMLDEILSAPQVTRRFDRPRTLVAALPFEGASMVSWSPARRHIAVGGQLTAQPESYGIRIFDADSGACVAKLAGSDEETREARWSSDGCLWLPDGADWQVYDPARRRSARVSFGLPPVTREQTRVFDPDRTTTVILSRHTEARTSNHEGFWTCRIWRGKVPQGMVRFRPRQGGMGGPHDFRFSPDRERLAFTVSTGGMDFYDRDQLWLLDLELPRATLLHEGSLPIWPLIDAPQQPTDPTWAPDGRTLFFGDQKFGIEVLDVATCRARRRLPARWAGRDVRASPCSPWIGFRRLEATTWGHESITVLNTQSREWEQAPAGSPDELIVDWCWNPRAPELAWVEYRGISSPGRLHVWRLSDPG